MVERLLAAGANPNAKLFNGETVLMTCSRTGDVKAVKALLVKGADVKMKEPEHDQTALMWAVAQRHPDVVQMLLEFGASVRDRSRIYPMTVVGEQTQRAGREKLNYTVLRGGATPLLFAGTGEMVSERAGILNIGLEGMMLSGAFFSFLGTWLWHDLLLGILLGVLVGEGSFGGDGRQPAITVRMHTRHEALFRRLTEIVPGSRLYGPYHHSARSYFQ